MTIYTVGYGNCTPTEFIKRLKDARIKWVYDVRRENCRSWCKEYYHIKKLLNSHGILYMHFPFLANRFESILEYIEYLNAISDRYINKEPGLDPINSILAVTRHESRNIALLCAEKDATRCHRKPLAERLVELLGENWEVKHL